MGYLITVSNSGVTNATNIGTVSNSVVTNMGYLTTVSNSGITNTTNIGVVSNRVNFLLNISNFSALTMSTSQGTFSSIVATNGYISSLFVDSLTVGFSTGYIYMPDIVTASLSSLQINTGNIYAQYGQISTVSASAVYGKFYGDGSALTGISGGGGGGSFSIPVLVSTNTLSTNLLTASNISTNMISTNQAFIALLSSPAIYGTFYGDGSALTGIIGGGGGGGGMSALPPVLSTTWLSTGLLTASNISATTISTSQAYISSLTVNTLQIGETTGYITMGDLLTNSISTNKAYISSINDAGYPINLIGYGGVKIIDTQSGYSGILSIGAGGALKWNGSNVTLT
jgi:hypothetical protein